VCCGAVACNMRVCGAVCSSEECSHHACSAQPRCEGTIACSQTLRGWLGLACQRFGNDSIGARDAVSSCCVVMCARRHVRQQCTVLAVDGALRRQRDGWRHTADMWQVRG
jgi:hypothetical protein